MPEFDPTKPFEKVVPEFNPDNPFESVTPEFDPTKEFTTKEDTVPITETQEPTKEQLAPADTPVGKPEGVVEELKRTFNKKKFTKDEIKKMADTYKKDPSWVKSAILAEGGDIEFETVEEALKSTIPGILGEVQQTFLLGAPRKAMRLLSSEEDKEALSDIARNVRARDAAIDIASSMTVAGKAATNVPLPKGIQKIGEATTALLSKVPKTKAVIDVTKPGVIASVLGVAQAPEGEELEYALFGGALGLGVGGLSKVLSSKLSTKQQHNIEELVREDIARRPNYENAVRDAVKGVEPTADELTVAAKELGISGRRIQAAIKRSALVGIEMTEEEAAQFLAKKHIDGAIFQFARNAKKEFPDLRTATMRMAKKELADYAAKSPNEAQYLTNVFDNFRRLKTVATKVREGAVPVTEATRYMLVNDFFDYMASSQHVAANADRIHGTAIEPALHAYTDSLSRHQNTAAKWFNDIRNPYVERIKDLNVDRTQIRKYIENPDLPIEDTNLAEAVKLTRDTFKKFREAAAEDGKLYIEEAENYFRRQVKRPEQVVASVNQAIEDLAAEGVNLKEKGLRGTKFQKLTNEVSDKEALKLTKEMWEGEPELLDKIMGQRKRASEVIRFLEDFSGTKITSSQELVDALTTINPRNGVGPMETYLSSVTRRRKGGIPEFVIENDPIKVMDTWVASASKTAMTRNELAKMTNIIDELTALGDEKHAKYFQEIVDDVYGRYEGVSHKVLEKIKRDRYVRIADKAKKIEELEATKIGITDQKTLKGIQDQIDNLEASKDLPRIQDHLSTMMYSNLLGWDLAKPLRNLTQPFVLTATEVGGLYGQEVAARGLIKSFTNFGSKMRALKESGQLINHVTRENVEIFSDQLSKMRGFRNMSKKAIEWYARTGLSIYQFSDTVNRVVTSNMSDLLVKDFTNKRGGAGRFLKDGLSSGYKNLLKGGKITTQEAIEQHLLNRTQFSYTKPALAKVARDMGPMLRTFTKWGSETLGDSVSKIREGRLSAGFNKYVGPYAIYSLADKYFEDELSDPRSKFFVGARGKLTPQAPLNNLAAAINGDIAIGPHLDILGKFLKGDFGKGAYQATKTYGPFGPGNAYRRLEQVITGEETEPVEASMMELMRDMFE